MKIQTHDRCGVHDGHPPLRLTHWRGIAACLAALTLMGPVRAGEVFNRDQVLLPFSPAAMVEGPAALRFNPAALRLQRGLAIDYYHAHRGSDLEGDDALFLSTGHFGFGTQWLGSGAVPDGRAYKIGVTSGNRHGLMTGTTYEWRSSDDPEQDKSHFWSHSLLWHPAPWLSVAAVADNYNRMKDSDGNRTDARFTYSAAVSFLDGGLKIGGDWYQTTSERVADGRYRLGASLEMNNGVTLFADIDQEEHYSLGARMNLATLFLGSQESFSSGNDHLGGVFYVGLHEERRPAVTTLRREVVHLTLQGKIPDRRPPRRLFGAAPLTTFDWINLLDRAATDPAVRAVVITLDNPRLGWGRLEELRRAIQRVRQQGKYTLVYSAGQMGNGEYYLATAADMIVVPPVATVNLIGLRAEVTFVKRLLDKIGIKADLEHIGDYKSASDLMTRTAMSPAHREALDRLLDDLDRVLRAGVAAGRGVDTARVGEWIDHGPYVSVDALEAGLVDAVSYADSLDDLVRRAAGPINARIGHRALARRLYHRLPWGAPPRVAVVFAAGSIAGGKDRGSLIGEIMGAETISRALRRAREDRRVKAIVLRINSGGGSVFASDDIWHEVSQTVGIKPIVVSFADVAASGGYYIACGADSIFALPNTVTGSIGIISGKLDLSGLYDKIGLDIEVHTRGRFADLSGATRSYDDDERQIVRAQMQRGYERFISLVAEGRGLGVDSVDALGQGRVWSGTAAHELGLIDGFADLHEVIRTAARMAGVKPGHEIAVEVLPRPGWQLFDLEPLGVSGATLPGFIRHALTQAGLVDEDLAYRQPYTITIR